MCVCVCVCVCVYTYTNILERPNQMKGNIWSSYFEIGKQTKFMLNRKRRKLTLMKKICLYNNSLYYFYNLSVSIIFSSVAQSCPTICDPMGYSMPGFPVHHQLPKLAQTHVHWFGDAIQLFHPLSSPSPPAFNLSQHQNLSKCVTSSYQVAKVLEFQLQHQTFQWTLRTAFL